VLFADIVGSTAIAEKLAANDLVATLDGLFSSFDDIAYEHGLEKIKTVGDNYFAVAGLSPSGPDDAGSAADAALEMRNELINHHFPEAGQVHMRFGLHTGPVIAGVIGKRKFSYDLWGDTVNTASRMESTSAPGMIQVSQQVYERLRDRYDLEPRGSIEVRGKSELSTYELIGKRATAI
jgi:class 3 adenylate cyclase